MKTLEKIGTIEAIFLITIVAVNAVILNFSKELIENAGSSSWLNIIFIGALTALFIAVLVKLYKPFRGNILDVSEYLFGNWFKVLIGVVYIFMYIMGVSLLLRDFSEKVSIIFLPQTPLLLIMLVFLIGAVLANKLGLKAIARTNLLINIVIFIGVFILFLGLVKFFSINRIFPILGNGLKETFMVNSINLYALTGISYLFLIKPHLKKLENYNKIAFASTLISCIYLFLTILSFILALPVKTISESFFSIYFISRIVEFGKLLQRTESLFVLSWILSSLSYISVCLFFILDIFKNIANIKDEKAMKYCLVAIILGCALVPKDNEQLHFLNNLYKNISTSVVFLLSFLIILFAYIKYKSRNKKREGELK